MTTDAPNYQKNQHKRILLLSLTLLLLIISFFYDISHGPGEYSLKTVWQTLLDKHSNGIKLEVIIWDYRLPIALSAVLVGATLSIAGAQMQTILNNPLAEPFTLGISSAASFGASLAIVLGWSVVPVVGNALVTVNAFVFSILTCMILLFVTKFKGVGSQTIVLFGIAIFFSFNAALAMMQYMASEDQISRIIFWMMGSLARSDWDKLGFISLLLCFSIAFCLYRSWNMTALRVGEESAIALGVNVARLRIEMLVLISILSATSVAFVGTVGFVGLVGPHIARILVGEDQRFFIPMSALVGALVLSLTSIISKSITPGVIYPIGIITSLIGVPIFVSILLTMKKHEV